MSTTYIGSRTPMSEQDWLELGWEPDDARKLVSMRSLTGMASTTTRVLKITQVDGGEWAIERLAHVVKHSPTGFEWGYGGSGPADLARSMLIDYLGEAAKCDGCNGSGRVPRMKTADHILTDSEPWAYCPNCGGEGYRLGVSYQDFKFALIARLPRDEAWQITDEQITQWLRERRVS